MWPPVNDADKKKLLIALGAIGILGVIVMALPLVIPLLGMLVTLGVIGAAIYGIYVYFTRKP